MNGSNLKVTVGFIEEQMSIGNCYFRIVKQVFWLNLLPLGMIILFEVCYICFAGVRYMPVLFHALCYEGIKALNARVRVFDLLNGICSAHRIIETRLTSQAQQIGDHIKMVVQVYLFFIF